MKTITARLGPAASRRLVHALEHAREQRGWTREHLADAGGCCVTARVINRWASLLRKGKPLSIDLDDALALLAAVGIASTEVDELLARLDDAVRHLVDDARTLTGTVTP